MTPTPLQPTTNPSQVDILILGLGWTGQFLLDLLTTTTTYTHAATTTTGSRPGSLPFRFDATIPLPELHSRFASLPAARYVLITFPLRSRSESHLLVSSYLATHNPSSSSPTTPPPPPSRWILLGSTGIWRPNTSSSTTNPTRTTTTIDNASDESRHWITRHSAYDSTNPRAQAEEELLRLGGTVLNLAGLWGGGTRDPRDWVARVGSSKEAVAGKGALHVVHGTDVARGILAVVRAWDRDDGGGGGDGDGDEAGGGKCCCVGQRWLVTDGRVWDWWGLMVGWAREGKEGGEEVSEQARWVWELMEERGTRALPRSVREMGLGYDSLEFWRTFGLMPIAAKL